MRPSADEKELRSAIEGTPGTPGDEHVEYKEQIN